MKKMLDELKKLDKEYEVPQDFRKKVMEQIKAEALEQKPKKNKIIQLKKYVIACASIAAMFIVVVNVGSLSFKSLSTELAGNTTASFDSAISVAPSNTPSLSTSVSSLNGINGVGIFDNIFDGLRYEEDVVMDSAANKAEVGEVQKVILTKKTIKNELEKINISYEEISGKIFIQKSDLENLKNTMDKDILNNLELVEKDDKIQIIIK